MMRHHEEANALLKLVRETGQPSRAELTRAWSGLRKRVPDLSSAPPMTAVTTVSGWRAGLGGSKIMGIALFAATTTAVMLWGVEQAPRVDATHPMAVAEAGESADLPTATPAVVTASVPAIDLALSRPPQSIPSTTPRPKERTDRKPKKARSKRHRQQAEVLMPATPKPVTPDASPLPTELELIRLARSQTNVGAYDRALRALSEHRARFPSGELARERLLLRVFALCGAGRTPEAQRAADQLREHAGRTYADARLGRSCVE